MSTVKPNEGRIPLSQLAELCNARAEEFYRHYLPGGRKDGRHWRCSNAWGGSGGSFYGNLTGPHKGKWRDESEDSSGDCFDILVAQFGKERAAQEAMAFLGISGDKPLPKREAPPPEAEVSWQEQPGRKLALRIWNEAQTIQPDTVGALYPDARMGRALEAYPPSMRYLRKCLYREPDKEDRHVPAILFRVDDLSGEFRGIQRVYLAKPDERLKTEHGKKSLGPVRGGAIRFRDPENGVLWVTEGPEKGLALSLVAPDGVGVWAAPGAGMMASLDLPDGLKELIIMADHDAA
jgi:hypothetical protein